MWPVILGHNLATAGALCAAFQMGIGYADCYYYGDDRFIGSDGEPIGWQPGCGRPAGEL
jgi:hypothetical protein